MHYSIQYKNARGITARSEFLPFASDAEAMLHGREGSGRDAIVEVWKGDKLLVRLFGVDTRKPTDILAAPSSWHLAREAQRPVLRRLSLRTDGAR